MELKENDKDTEQQYNITCEKNTSKTQFSLKDLERELNLFFNAYTEKNNITSGTDVCKLSKNASFVNEVCEHVQNAMHNMKDKVQTKIYVSPVVNPGK